MKRRRPTPAEYEILRVLWSRGPSTVREVHEALGGEGGYTTTLKLMQIMSDKGLVARDRSERAHYYEAVAERDRCERSAVDDLIEHVFGGSAGRLMLHALSTKKATPQELAEIRRLIDEASR
ncbi:MAG TPA: transcriptional regulator [Solibacterales bacterium]|nr:transcriptional regulator [Bryobacterales bacterium]